MLISSRLKRAVNAVLLTALTTSLLPSQAINAQENVRTPDQALPNQQPILVNQAARYASVAINLRSEKSFVKVGSTTTFKVDIRNVGALVASNIIVSLPVPKGVTPISKDGLNADGSEWIWQMSTLEPGKSHYFEVSVQANENISAGAIIATATVNSPQMAQPIASNSGFVLIPNIAERNPNPTTSADGRVVLAESKAVNPTWTMTTDVSTVHPTQRGLAPVVVSSSLQSRGAVKIPTTLVWNYTDAQLTALGIDAADLTLYHYVAEQNRWEVVASDLDLVKRQVTARIAAQGPYQLGDGSTPAEAFLPSLQAWQTSLFTGAATSSYPIDVPAGPAGIKPNIALSYNSTSSDGRSGMRAKQQAGWVGRDWSLDSGSISANVISVNPATANIINYYSLSVNGIASDLMRGDALIANPQMSNPTHWAWRMTDESFAKVQVAANGVSTSSRGGFVNGQAQARYTWTIWSKDGTRYEFQDDLWWGWNDCSISNKLRLETYKWMLTRTVDPHGNSINYSYGRDTFAGALRSCDPYNNAQAKVDREVWPTEITWGGNINTGAIDRYRVVFDVEARTNDLTFDDAPNQYEGTNGAVRQTKLLDQILVYSKQATTWELVRGYDLNYDYSTSANISIQNGSNYTSDTSTSKLTLTSIQRLGNTGTTGLPLTTFTYGARVNAPTPNASWNRLTQVNNGQGGTINFAYETIGLLNGNNKFINNHRVTSKTLNDGRGNSYTTNYSYSNAAYNSIGTLLDTTQSSVQQYANSAVLYYNLKFDQSHDNSAWLQHQANTEFRGHSKVVERDSNGNETDHYFYQGDAGCNPTATGTGSQIFNDLCFQQIRDREILKGKEYRTVQRQGVSSTMLWEALNTYTVEMYSYGATPLSGLWSSFNYTNEVANINRDAAPSGGPTETVNRTKYYYEPINQGGAQYGNVTKVEELDVTGAVYRSTINTYSPNTSSAYIVDRLVTQVIRDGQNRVLALTENRYDNAVTTQAVGTRGLPTLVRKYTNVPLAASTTGVTLTSRDTSFGYDTYGNQTTVTTYAQAGTRLFNGSTTTFSAPGNGSTSSTVTTTYDATFHAFSTSISQPTGNTNSPTLNESAGYNYRMGTLTSVTDANGIITNAEYDAFGRMVALIKPGDSSTLPTVKAHYEDAKIPFHYWTETREHSGLSGVRIDSQFYDGIGRKIQTKQESVNASQTIVIDAKYDGMGQVTHQSQPRYVAETSTSFWEYTAIPGTGVNWATTTYDSLGRVLTLTTPDGAKTNNRYWQYNNMSVIDTIDPNRSRTQQRFDQFGRLVQVQELSGNCTTWAFFSDFSCTGNYTTTWASYGMTTYAYSPLDLLTTSTDANNNVTSMTYDSAGRKLTMNDPDMGAWSYSYDVDGNLVSQTDANNQTLSFDYDTLNRLTAKKQGSTTLASYSYDQFGNGYPYGKGQLTTMTNASGSTTYGYTPRGEIQYRSTTIDGTLYSIMNTYRSDGNINSEIYPTGEIISYSYDDAGRQNGVTSSLGEMFQTNVTYDALGQKTNEFLGNGQQSNYSYDSLSQRLTSMQTYDVALLQERFSRAFTYDLAGNVQTITSRDALNPNEIMRYSYDHRDRVTNACAVSSASSSICIGGATFNQSYGYDVIGNITTKAGVNYSYTNGKPHAVSSVGGQNYLYYSNGNMFSGGGRSYTWNIENQPTQISTSTVTETYKYDGNNARVKKTTTTGSTVKSVVYIGAVEYWSDGKVVSNYAGIASRTTTGNPSTTNRGSVIYFHTDHLGSIGAVTNSSGTVIEAERYDPWGATRSGNLSSTEFGYTGQRKDDGTGLLFYNARYYDPAIARFTSADSIVPNASHRSLTIDFHEVAFLAKLAQENRQKFWFQMDARNMQSSMPSWGTENPQALNRYSYVANNPLNYADPSGHEWKTYWEGELEIWEAQMVGGYLQQLVDTMHARIKEIDQQIEDIENGGDIEEIILGGVAGGAGAVIGEVCDTVFPDSKTMCEILAGVGMGAGDKIVEKTEEARRQKAIKELRTEQEYLRGSIFFLNRVIGGLKSAIADAKKNGKKTVFFGVYINYSKIGIPWNIKVRTGEKEFKLFK
ncbi:RHS repeat-associated core domain-containing protein [Herpetosiphon giganteus]|uniref:RHS repeat-associated core domain-containing protein n=1 Tax=Herpetosiphon giganteus TaxID=2029754 RepID=UPI001958C9E0|nr:RHS repeat-associated core domain-containing protein [Herpetosiphon giganteus]